LGSYPPAGGSNPRPSESKTLMNLLVPYIYTMFTVYALHSPAYNKIYIGYTSNLELRLTQHNSTSDKGFTTKYRPWVVIHTENFATKKEAMTREKQLKTAKGREFIYSLIKQNPC